MSEDFSNEPLTISEQLEELKIKVTELEKEKEKMKCCQNCRFFLIPSGRTICHECTEILPKLTKWQIVD